MAKHITDPRAPDAAICGRKLDPGRFAYSVSEGYAYAASGRMQSKGHELCRKCADRVADTLASVRENDPPGLVERAAAAIRRAYVG